MTGQILTVGLRTDNLVFSVKENNTDYVAFIGTEQSIREYIDNIVEETGLKPSRFKTYETPDTPNDLSILLKLFKDAYHWLLKKGIAKQDITVDPTGGLKWMSIGMQMGADFLKLQLKYVKVEYINGRPDPDTMSIVPLGNIHDQSGIYIGDQGRTAFNRTDFETAAYYFHEINPTSSSKAELFSGLEELSKALAKWDRFEHYSTAITSELEKAIEKIERSIANNNYSSMIISFNDKIKGLTNNLKELEERKQLNLGFVTDLFMNAKRRFTVNRFDDCVARLYRTLEAISQYSLEKDFNINTNKVDYSEISEEVKDIFKKKCNGNLPEKIDLKKGFILLYLLDHPVGKSMINDRSKGKLQLKSEKYLKFRNDSILAHGLTPVSRDNAENFFSNVENSLKECFGDEFIKYKENLTVPEMPPLGL